MTVTDRRPPFRFAHKSRVGFDETDAQGIVYYGRYMPYFDRARVEYLRFLSLLHAHGDDDLEVYVRIARIGASSVGWAFAAYDVASAELLATARQTMVHVDLESRRPAPVPDAYR